MSEHLPECFAVKPHTFIYVCICERLKDCEDRVSKAFHVVRRDDMAKWEKFARDQFDAGYDAGAKGE